MTLEELDENTAHKITSAAIEFALRQSPQMTVEELHARIYPAMREYREKLKAIVLAEAPIA